MKHLLALLFASSLIGGEVSPDPGSEGMEGDFEGEPVEEYGEVDEDIIIEDEIDPNDDEGVQN